MAHRLSKTKLMNGWQCAKRLWLEKYKSEEAIITAQMQVVFDNGHKVGAAAQALFPDGYLIEHDAELDQALFETEDKLAQDGPVTLFEATFRAADVLVRADVLERDQSGIIRMIEVKGATEVKGHYTRDAAIQLWVLEEAGQQVDKLELAHVNNEFVYQGDSRYAGLLTHVDVMTEARSLLSDVPRLISEAQAVLDNAEPDVRMGAQCKKPHACPFIDYCAGPQSEYPVSSLYRITRPKIVEMEEAGYADIRDIPDGYLRNKTHLRMRAVILSGEPALRPDAAMELAALGWPRYYFDFETLGPAVPLYKGTKPYKNYPFQWSCHIEHPDGTLVHEEFLADGSDDMFRESAKAMVATLGDAGPIIVYSDFERRTIGSLIDLLPDLEVPLEAIQARLFDLLPVTQRNYYHPAMQGSWSIKAVLPTVAPDLSYDELEDVKVGTDAAVAFEEMIAPATVAERAEQLRIALLTYCKLDTEAMVRLAWFLEGRS